MATELLPVQAAAPAPSVTVAAAPAPPAASVARPETTTTTLRADVPIIKPYTVSAFTGDGVLGVIVGAIRATAAAVASGAGMLLAPGRATVMDRAEPGGNGRAAAKVVVKSGPVVLSAFPTGAGTASGTLNAGVLGSAGADAAATVSFRVISTVDAIFHGEGRFSGLEPFGIETTGSGALAAEISAVGPVVVASEGTGVGAFTAATGQPVHTAGAGSLTVAQGSPAAVAGIGQLSPSLYINARAPADHLAGGTLSMQVRAVFKPSSMTKVGTFSAPNNEPVVIPGWAADTVGYPGSTVASDGLVMQAPKSAATLSASIKFAASTGFVAEEATLQLTVNGAVIATGAPTAVPAGSTATATVSTVRDVAAGDVIKVMVKGAGGTFGSYQSIAQPGATSYVRVI